MMNTHHQDMNRLEVQIGQLANSLNERQKGTQLSQPLPNPKNPFPIHEVKDIGPSQCNTIHILRSGKRIDNKVSNQPNKSVSAPPVLVQPTQDNPSSSSQPSTFKSNDQDKTNDNHTSLLYHSLIG